jgi:hypothetical protein
MPEYEFDLSELDAEGESAERAPIKKPSSQPSFKPRPAPGTPTGVTQAQLEAALTRVDGKIKTVADGISTISTRVNSLTSAAKKEADERKKGIDTQGKDVNQKLQMLALLPMLIQPPSSKLQAPLNDANGNPTITAVSTPDNSPLDAILPLLLVSGLGGTSSSGISLGGDGSDNGMMLMALVLAFANQRNN